MGFSEENSGLVDLVLKARRSQTDRTGKVRTNRGITFVLAQDFGNLFKSYAIFS